MKILVTLPIEIYNGLLEKCAVVSREYLILKNGVIRSDHEERADPPAVEILCELKRAKFLFDLATLIYPEAAPYIEKSINLTSEGDDPSRSDHHS